MLILAPPNSTLFPYTTLFRSEREVVVVLRDAAVRRAVGIDARAEDEERSSLLRQRQIKFHNGPGRVVVQQSLHRHVLGGVDRKSTRLNSSHLGISYAVFCLKK